METFDKMVYIHLSNEDMPDSIVINLNTAFSALSYYISNEIANITQLNDIEKSLIKIQKLIEISNNQTIIGLHYDDEDNLAYYIMYGLKLKLQKELLN